MIECCFVTAAHRLLIRSIFGVCVTRSIQFVARLRAPKETYLVSTAPLPVSSASASLQRPYNVPNVITPPPQKLITPEVRLLHSTHIPSTVEVNRLKAPLSLPNPPVALEAFTLSFSGIVR